LRVLDERTVDALRRLVDALGRVLQQDPSNRDPLALAAR